MQGYQTPDQYGANYADAGPNNGWNYTLFGYYDQPQSNWSQYGYDPMNQYDAWSQPGSANVQYTPAIFSNQSNLNNAYVPVETQSSNASTLKSKIK
jgi:hypothetical protein